MTGTIYLLYFCTAILAGVCAKGLVVSGDAAATAQNIIGHRSSFLLAFAFNLIANAFYLALTALFYELFRPVDRRLSFLAALFSLVGCTIQVFGAVFQLVSISLLDGSTPYLAAFSGPQLQALALLFLKSQLHIFNVGVVFFAFFCLVIGYLIYKSTFLPRIFGILLVLAGLGWLTYLVPSLANSFSRYTQPFGFLAELALMIWLLVKGVDETSWQARAAETL